MIAVTMSLIGCGVARIIVLMTDQCNSVVLENGTKKIEK